MTGVQIMEPFRVAELTLAGSPRDRGEAHGSALRSQIEEAIAGFSGAIQKGTGKEPAEIFREIVRDAGFLTAAQRLTPHLVDEILGIADGAGIDFETIFAWQLIQEMAWFPVEQMRSLDTVPGCTSLGACPARGSTIVAQTVDGTGWGRGRGTLIHLTDPSTGIRAHLLGWPGLIGVYGLNDRGIGVCCNSMFFDVSHSTAGLGALFMVRTILAQASFEDVDRVIRATPHASGTNFMVGAPGHTVSYEVSGKQVTAYSPKPDGRMTYHTNHALANDDLIPPPTPGWDTNSIARLESVRGRMEQTGGGLTWQDAREIISAHDDPNHPICRHYESDEAGMTLWGIVMECTADPVLHISAGPPCNHEFQTFAF